VTETEIGNDGGVYGWQRTAHYEPGLVLAGNPLDPEIWPTAEDDFTYRYEPDDRAFAAESGGFRTQIRSDGDRTMFVYDGGHLVDAFPARYVWEDDHMVQVDLPAGGQYGLDTSYEYDEAGNLLRKAVGTSADGPRYPEVTTYDYGCWD